MSMLWQIKGGPASAGAAITRNAPAIAAKYFKENIFRNFMSSSLLVYRTSCKNKDATRKQLLTPVELRLLPLPPYTNIVKAELIPPRVQHPLLALFNSFASDAVGRRNRRVQRVKYTTAVRDARAAQQVPQRQRVIFSRVREHDAQLCASFCIAQLCKIEFGERRPKFRGSVFKKRSARSDSWPRFPDRTCGNKRFAAVEPKTHPSHRCAQQPGAVFIDLQRVSASQIDGQRRRGVHHELARRRPDHRVNRSALQIQPRSRGSRLHQPQSRLRLDVHLPDLRYRDARARLPVGLQSLPNLQRARFTRTPNGLRSHTRRSSQLLHSPANSASRRFALLPQSYPNRKNQQHARCHRGELKPKSRAS